MAFSPKTSQNIGLWGSPYMSGDYTHMDDSLLGTVAHVGPVGSTGHGISQPPTISPRNPRKRVRAAVSFTFPLGEETADVIPHFRSAFTATIHERHATSPGLASGAARRVYNARSVPVRGHARRHEVHY